MHNGFEGIVQEVADNGHDFFLADPFGHVGHGAVPINGEIHAQLLGPVVLAKDDGGNDRVRDGLAQEANEFLVTR